jgi:hypothetical protein
MDLSGKDPGYGLLEAGTGNRIELALTNEKAPLVAEGAANLDQNPFLDSSYNEVYCDIVLMST